ncbi:MAG: signal peptidase I [Oscillospiraceae bacterium]|nr:signal peptidase I [Oscillospiraceae bacterium]
MAENTKPMEPEQTQQTKEKAKSTPLSILYDFLDMVESVLISCFVVMLLFGFVLRPVKVDGSSMVPTLYNMDQLLMVSLFYQPAYGDIVVVNGDYATLFSDAQQTVPYETQGTDINLVKRVIATGGQTIDIDFDTGNITIDGELLDQSFIKLSATRNEGAFTYPMTVPEGYCFVMGDNRNGSMDSRHPSVGLISEDQVLGHVVLRYGREDEHCRQWTDRFAVYN